MFPFRSDVVGGKLQVEIFLYSGIFFPIPDRPVALCTLKFVYLYIVSIQHHDIIQNKLSIYQFIRLNFNAHQCESRFKKLVRNLTNVYI